MAEKGTLSVRLKNFENQRLRNVRTRFTYFRNDKKVDKTITRDFASAREVFEFPVFPLGNWRCSMQPSRYETWGFFFPVNPGGKTVDRDLLIPRNPRAGWRARFDKWSGLTSRYAPLKKLLDRSPRLELKIKGTNQRKPLGRFAERVYDDVDERHLIDGKSGMLNLFAKMAATNVPGMNGRTWWTGIEELLVIQRDRVIGIATRQMAELIQQMSREPNFFPFYNRASATLHPKNIRAGLAVLGLDGQGQMEPLSSVKTREKYGVLQLTIGPVKNSSGETLYILDADIDENGQLLKHFGDTIKHRFNGGTHPFHVYDILHRTVDQPLLGYSLV